MSDTVDKKIDSAYQKMFSAFGTSEAYFFSPSIHKYFPFFTIHAK